MSDSVADVVVVGAGVIGLSVARELSRAGVDRVVVLERGPSVGQGSSSRANGGVRAQFTTRINIAFSIYSIEEFERLRASYRELLSFHQTGYLLFTGTDPGEAVLRAGFALQREAGVETEWLSPEQVLERAPFVRPDELRSGTFHARDGFLDPHGVVTALAAEAGRTGASIRTSTEVSGIRATGKGFDVETSRGPLRSRWVVNAAGAWAAEVAGLLSEELPVAPVRRNLAFVHLEDGGGLIPMCVDLDTGVLVRKEAKGGYVIAYSDPEDLPSWDTTVDPGFLDALGARIGHRFPFLENVPIDLWQCWAGLYPETPDHHAVVGEGEVPGFIHAAGFGGHGLMHSPAAGLAVAELVTRGRCETFDLRPLRPSRFAEGDLVVETAVL